MITLISSVPANARADFARLTNMLLRQKDVSITEKNQPYSVFKNEALVS